jgi:hypothetical protein
MPQATLCSALAHPDSVQAYVAGDLKHGEVGPVAAWCGQRSLGLQA